MLSNAFDPEHPQEAWRLLHECCFLAYVLRCSSASVVAIELVGSFIGGTRANHGDHDEIGIPSSCNELSCVRSRTQISSDTPAHPIMLSVIPTRSRATNCKKKNTHASAHPRRLDRDQNKHEIFSVVKRVRGSTAASATTPCTPKIFPARACCIRKLVRNLTARDHQSSSTLRRTAEIQRFKMRQQRQHGRKCASAHGADLIVCAGPTRSRTATMRMSKYTECDDWLVAGQHATHQIHAYCKDQARLDAAHARQVEVQVHRRRCR